MRDPRQAETTFFLLLATLVLAIIVAQFFLWAFMEPTMQQDPRGQTAQLFWISQVCALLLFVLVAVIGFKPPITLSLTTTQLTLQQGKHVVHVPWSDIVHYSSVSALCYHRTYRPYGTTRHFVNRITPEILILSTCDQVFAAGLPPADHQALIDFLCEHA